jgi:membrane associated rhomboid family serine protease
MVNTMNNVYPTQSSWAVPVLAGISLVLINFTQQLMFSNPYALADFLTMFGFSADNVVVAIQSKDAGVIAYVALTAIVHQFLHINLAHFTGNILLMFVFGRRVERFLGGWRFLAFYLTCGIVASLGAGIFTGDYSTPGVGASGGVTALMGAYVAHVLHTRGKTRWDLVAGILLSLGSVYAVVQEVAVLAGYVEPMSFVSYGAHVVGWLFGYLLMAAIIYLRARSNRIRISPPVHREPVFEGL